MSHFTFHACVVLEPVLPVVVPYTRWLSNFDLSLSLSLSLPLPGSAVPKVFLTHRSVIICVALADTRQGTTMRVARMVERWRAQGGGDQFRGVSIAVSRAFACATQRRLQSTAQCEIKARHQAAPALSTYEVCNLGEGVGAHKDLSPMCTAEFYFDRRNTLRSKALRQ